MINLILHGMVIGVESGSQFVDKKRRVRIRFEECGQTLHYSTLEIPHDSLQLEDLVHLRVFLPMTIPDENMKAAVEKGLL